MAQKVKTYEQIIEMANKKPLTVKQFNNYFKPIENEDGNGYLIDYSNEAEQTAKEYIKENNLTTQVYQHIWTVVDGSSGKLCTINGWHMCNRLAYIVCKTPWGNGTDSDKNVYIEAKY